MTCVLRRRGIAETGSLTTAHSFSLVCLELRLKYSLFGFSYSSTCRGNTHCDMWWCTVLLKQSCHLQTVLQNEGERNVYFLVIVRYSLIRVPLYVTQIRTGFWMQVSQQLTHAFVHSCGNLCVSSVVTFIASNYSASSSILQYFMD